MKFLDERCKGRPTKIFHIRTSGDLPKGQTCFMDEGGYGTYLDGKMMSPPLSYLNVVATDTSAPRVYEVNYTFANDVLTDESNLGKALIAKYGPPTQRNEPSPWPGSPTTWSCAPTVVRPRGPRASSAPSSSAMMGSWTPSAIQRGFEDEQKLKNGPPAPKL